MGIDPTVQRGKEQGIWEESPWDLACREVVGLEGPGGRACRRQGEGTRRGSTGLGSEGGGCFWRCPVGLLFPQSGMRQKHSSERLREGCLGRAES